MDILPHETWSDILEFAVGSDVEISRFEKLRDGSIVPKDVNKLNREQKRLRDARQAVLLVCSSWKRSATKHLYASPSISSIPNFTLYANTLIKSDEKHQLSHTPNRSKPGSYTRSLDLSRIKLSAEDTVVFTTTLIRLLDVLPVLENLRLPEDNSSKVYLGRSFLKALGECEAVQNGSLKVFEGLTIFNPSMLEPDHHLSLLAKMTSLESLSINGLGPSDTTNTSPLITPDIISLPRLKTLSISSLHHGPVLGALAASPLPSLKTLSITSYHDTEFDLTTPLLRNHGPNLQNVVFLPKTDWPRSPNSLPSRIFCLLPVVESLTISSLSPELPTDFFTSSPPEGDISQQSLYTPVFSDDSTHPLRTLTLPRPNPTHLPTDLIIALQSNPPPNLSTIIISNFAFLKPPPSPSLGPVSRLSSSPTMTFSHAALDAGLNGVIRRWAAQFSKLPGGRSICLKDKNGIEGCPKILKVGEKEGFGTGMSRRERRRSMGVDEDEEELGG